MKLRNLSLSDAPLMLEWMHDLLVTKYMQEDFAHKTLDDCKTFIIESQKDIKNLHLAITDNNDEYMGTVSLKHITDHDAEFAIAVRKSAMGKGFAQYGMRKIIDYGLISMGLSSIYWCVLPENKRAIRFYDKGGWKVVTDDKTPLKYGGGGYTNGQSYQKVHLVFGNKAKRKVKNACRGASSLKKSK